MGAAQVGRAVQRHDKILHDALGEQPWDTLHWKVILTRRRTVEIGAVLPPSPWFRTDGSRWCSLR